MPCRGPTPARVTAHGGGADLSTAVHFPAFRSTRDNGREALAVTGSRRSASRVVALAFALLSAMAPVAAQTPTHENGYPVDPLSLPRPTLRAERTAEEIHVDGHLDEAAWASADSSTTAFIQVTPSPGYPATERTIVRILYDDRNLYIGATLYESEPDRLVVPGLEQDYDTQSADMFAVALDTYHDMQNGFVFAINPAGAVWDAQTFNDQRDIIPAWEGIISVRTSIGDDRWTVELAIPFNTLRYNPSSGEQTWGLGFSRRIRHHNEDSNWSPTPRQFRLYKFSLAGTLTGLQNLRPGRNLWIKPWVLGDRLGGAAQPGGRNELDGGFDVKWGVTPRLTLDLTTNTDFSQVEVDAEQVNLTRFSLFFPEKRDFFLENEGTFAFQDVTIRNYRTGSSSRNFTLFHSRTIGLSPRGPRCRSRAAHVSPARSAIASRSDCSTCRPATMAASPRTTSSPPRISLSPASRPKCSAVPPSARCS